MTTNFAAIRNRIASACARCGRDPQEIVLIGAAKRQPPERLLAVHADGLIDFGENIVQEALRHRDLLPGGVVWHLIGPLQSNKANKAVRLFDWVHSIDRPKIAHALARAATQAERSLTGLIEVNLGEEPSKHGFSPRDLAAQVQEFADLESLRIDGLMAIPPPAAAEDESRRWFRRLRELRDDLFSRTEWADRAGFLSMGMSGDFEVAIEEGATHIRIGTALFGRRLER